MAKLTIKELYQELQSFGEKLNEVANRITKLETRMSSNKEVRQKDDNALESYKDEVDERFKRIEKQVAKMIDFISQQVVMNRIITFVAVTSVGTFITWLVNNMLQ